MERKLWRKVYPILARLGRAVRTPHVVYEDAEIVAVHLWAVLHDRPVAWACRRENWPFGPRPGRLPSAATVSRRLRSGPVAALPRALEDEVRGACDGEPGEPAVVAVDGKPLPVSDFTKDPEARRGWAAGGFRRGYKLTALWGPERLPRAWDVRPMNEAEQTIATELLGRTRPGGAGDCLLGDAAFDVNKLYEAAAAVGCQLLAPRKRPGAGLGSRRHSPHRLRGLEILATDAGATLYRLRGRIEQRFARLTNSGTGLKPLPNWVRRLPRVRRRVQAKLIVNALEIELAG